MIQYNHKSLIDELEKIAVRLSPEEQRTQALQFAGLGAVTAPAIAVAKNLVQYGKVSPFSNTKRFLAANIVGGGLTGGVLPVIQHKLERNMQDAARDRQMLARLDNAMTQVKTSAVKAGGMMGALLIEKAATMNLTGRDNRTPFVGGTQFPTEGSKSKAKQLGDLSKSKAEVGPAPLMGKLDKTKMTTLKDVSVKMPSAAGSIPPIGG